MGVNPRGKSAEDTVPSNDSIDTAIVPNISRDLVDNVDVEQPSTSQTEKPKDTPPEGGYGWVCVICVTFINAHTWGVNAVCPTSVKSLMMFKPYPSEFTDGLKLIQRAD